MTDFELNSHHIRDRHPGLSMFSMLLNRDLVRNWHRAIPIFLWRFGFYILNGNRKRSPGSLLTTDLRYNLKTHIASQSLHIPSLLKVSTTDVQ